MTLTPAQLAQRRRAPLKHGATSGSGAGALRTSDLGKLQRQLYDRLLWRVRRATGRTTLGTRLALEKVAYYGARIELADAWLAEQRDPLFRDRSSGELWPIIAKVDEWVSAQARYVAQLPGGPRATDDVTAILGRHRRG